MVVIVVSIAVALWLSSFYLQGSHSTKIEAIVRTLLSIKSTDSEAKCLVFSTVSFDGEGMAAQNKSKNKGVSSEILR